VHKKQAKVDIEDLFGDEMVSSSEHHDLFAEPTAVDDKTSTSTGPTEQRSSRRVSSSNPFKRSALLNKQIGFMKPRLGSSPLETEPKIRSRTWLTMMQLAKDGEDMKKVVDLLPMLHAGGGGGSALPSLFAEEFVRRCEQLGCQPLALEVFGNYAKYNVTLTPNAGRWLIHSIHVLYPLKDLLIAASLFSIYNISLTEDLVSASMFAAACFKHDTSQSRAVANLLLPEIKRMVEEEEKKKKLTDDVERKRQLKWVDWSLMKINKFAKKASGEPLVVLPEVKVQVEASVVHP